MHFSLIDLGHSGGCQIFFTYFGVRETQCNKRQVRACSGMDSLFHRKLSMNLHSCHWEATLCSWNHIQASFGGKHPTLQNLFCIQGIQLDFRQIFPIKIRHCSNPQFSDFVYIMIKAPPIYIKDKCIQEYLSHISHTARAMPNISHVGQLV